MKFVAKCSDCGEQRILNEWGRCKSCFDKWFEEMMQVGCPAEYLTDSDSWYILGPEPPSKSRLGPRGVSEKFAVQLDKHIADVQRAIDLKMREIFLKYSKQSTYPNLSKPPEKI